MDLVEVFEGMYMETCEKEVRILKKGNRLSSSTDDRFRVTWEVEGLQINGEHDFDGTWWIVTETIKNKKEASRTLFIQSIFFHLHDISELPRFNHANSNSLECD